MYIILKRDIRHRGNPERWIAEAQPVENEQAADAKQKAIETQDPSFETMRAHVRLKS